MTRQEMEHLVAVARGDALADLVIANARIADLGRGLFFEGNLAIAGDKIAGLGADYRGKEVYDAKGLYALPAFIDSHIHIESSMLSPEEFARVAVPHGTGSIVADPHEIVNVAGLRGLRYMQSAAARTALRVEFMLPSCVPATPFEHSGAELKASDMEDVLPGKDILGLAEMMNFPGVVNGDPEVLDKVLAARVLGKPIDGHSPGLSGAALCAYAAAGIMTDHECSTIEEMEERLRLGFYILLRHGSACHDLERLLPAVTAENARRCLLCSDDRQAATFLQEGHVDDLLRRCVAFGIPPMTALRMATLNAAEAYGLKDRGALFPGRLADIVIVRDLQDFDVQEVWLGGQHVSSQGRYLLPIEKASADSVSSSVHLSGFSEERLKLKLSSSKVRSIELLPGGVVTGEKIVDVKLLPDGDVDLSEAEDLVRLSVLERHHGLGTLSNGLLSNYGLKRGAVALTISHDSHHLIVAGRDISEMAVAVRALEKMGGGCVLVLDGKVLSELPLPIAGLMSDQSAEKVASQLEKMHQLAIRELGVSSEIDPLMSLCFMSLLVIPKLKLSDMGLFDAERFEFVDLEVEDEK